MAARKNERSYAISSCSSVEKDDDGCDEEDPQLPLVTNSVRIGSDPDQAVVEVEATPDDIPLGWTRTKSNIKSTLCASTT
jgi:hypothetical protein